MEDTIAAIATPPGEGGIGIIRISGCEAESILNQIFVPVSKDGLSHRKMAYGNIVDPSSKNRIDEVLCVLMHKPKTYTAEDVVEINCHGGMVPLRKTLELVLSLGARLAEPGEFTKRAFLNGRLDLSQAEAVIDVIKAKTDKTFDVAMNQLEGCFSKTIKDIRNELIAILVKITVNIDYPDEDIEEITYEQLETDLLAVKMQVGELLQSAHTGRLLREGLAVSIIGKPNVGKSSLMNRLLKESRAIVTEIPGTTRDTIEEQLSIGGFPVRLTDTAGIRQTSDVIEKIGIEKSKDAFNVSDLVMFLIDSSRPLSEEDLAIVELVEPYRTIVVLNKCDLDQVVTKEELYELMPLVTVIETSMETNQGIKEIEEEITSMMFFGEIHQKESVLVTNARHQDLLSKANQALLDGIEMTRRREALEFIEIDVNSSYAALGEIIGETVADDIIDEVFSRFCLGK
ncbi:tRNA modification GTPase [Clostridiales Family XIII bacterium PM5-7]